MAFLREVLVLLALLISLFSFTSALNVSHDGRALLINGQRRILFSGSIHYPRSTPGMWPDLIQKAKDGGLDAIETYVFWNAHEPHRRQYNFEGNLDIVRFIKEIQKAGLYAVLRIGPYTCAEWNYGGLPVWLHQIPGMQIRTNNQLYKDEMQKFTTLIVDKIKQEKLFASQGGPIILAQIENEYGNIQQAFGEPGKQYVQWCANMAESLGIHEPWIMCQQQDAPQPMINTCNGFYCDWFTPNNPNSPKMWTENWSGWFKDWSKATPNRQAEELAYAVARFYQRNGTFQNYYMYHGGTNFGRTAGGPFITTSYDYDAPLDEYGNLRQPKYGHLRELHAAIKLMEKALTYGEYSSNQLITDVWATKFSGEGILPGCFLTNTRHDDVNVTYLGNEYFVPGWSVSILPDCKLEVYNTAKVNTQTSIMVKKPNGIEGEPGNLTWSWRIEKIKNTLLGRVEASQTANKLLEQKLVSADDSDYLWYITSVNLPGKEHMILRVNTSGPILYAFVNGQLVGSQYGQPWNPKFEFENTVRLRAGKNHIALLSATVGLPNYGAHFDIAPFGVNGGPVQLIGGNNTIDLSNNLWSYKVGLDGENNQLYLENLNHEHRWHSSSLLKKRPFTWYKTYFQAPLGLDPVVVDLKGMGKGMAWVNGNSIGRYWPTQIASSACNPSCDPKKPFNDGDNSCRTGCGEPTQRWYHVPRSFLNANDKNTLVLLEEAGGDPSEVSFQTVTVGTVCGDVPDGKTLNLSCQGGQKISAIKFASFGNPSGKCGSFQIGNCNSQSVLSAVTEACVGKESCSIMASENALGACDCVDAKKRRLAVQVVC